MLLYRCCRSLIESHRSPYYSGNAERVQRFWRSRPGLGALGIAYTCILTGSDSHRRQGRLGNAGKSDKDALVSVVQYRDLYASRGKKVPTTSQCRSWGKNGVVRDGQKKSARGNIRSNQFAINKQLMTAKSWKEVLRIVEKNLDEFNTVNIATAYLKLGKFVRYRRDLQDVMKATESSTLNAMTRKLMQHMGEIEPRELCNAVLGLVYLRDKQRFLILDKAISTRIVSTIESFDPQGIANTLWAYTTFEIQPTEDLESRCLNHVFANMEKYKPLVRKRT